MAERGVVPVRKPKHQAPLKIRGKQSRWLPLFETFIQNLRIQSKHEAGVEGEGIPLKLWTSQRRFMEELALGLEAGQRTLYCLKARQLGVTTVSLAIDIFWLALHPGTIGCLVSDNDENRKKNRRAIELYMASMPEDFLGEDFRLVNNNNNFLSFSNNSLLDLIVAGTSSKKSWGDGKAYSFCHATEVARYGSAEGLASFRETLSEHNPNRLYIFESTAKGQNHWKDMWDAAADDEYTIRRMFIGWWSNDLNRIEKTDPRFRRYGYEQPDGRETDLINAIYERHAFVIADEQLAWIRWRENDRSADPTTLMQNLPWVEEDAFASTGATFFSGTQINHDLLRIDDPENPISFKAYRYFLGTRYFESTLQQINDPERRREIELRVWEEPVVGGKYVIGCDPAMGRNDHKDRHSISVWRCYADCVEQVAEYADNNVETVRAAWVLFHLASAYRDCLVCIELSGGMGDPIMTEFNRLRDFLRQDMDPGVEQAFGWEDVSANIRWYLYHKPDSIGAGYAYHWKSSRDNQFTMMSEFNTEHRGERLRINSKPLCFEMLNVVVDGGHIGAPDSRSETGKDDRVFAAGLAIKAWIDWVQKPMMIEGMTYARVKRKEEGQGNDAGEQIGRMVSNWLRRLDEPQELETPNWMREMGLM